ncbi:capsid protein precursor [Bovine astrovirus B76-2/HK]|uniref:capsid protein precursor n=1 Tax=Bovine astrovirus B76-2/HK TaxID=1027247 RepID=UPI00020CD90E|nr:capsid protein precursor [Bovine astrovirus B76-2/HK]AED89612.1 capsid protein precursor [Bovine astrovirus B76-2/HK]
MSSWIVFGGEDQRQILMASRKQQNRRATRNTTNIVVRNGAAANQAGAVGGQRRRRNRRNNKAPQVNVRVLSNQAKGFRRNPRRQGVGNRVVFQKINTTLGTVGSNGSEQIECELTCLMNPATMKEATGSNSFGPLGIYASTYSLFRMTRCTVTLKPLVGDSAVSGTVARVSWNPTSTPTQTSWSALGARKHVDVTPGKTGKFTLTTRDLVGPKGGWYKTNTKGDPMMSFAGTLEVHTLGRTMSTYRNEQFNGGLFLAELETEWQFKDYSQQPGMLNLIKGEDTQQSHIQTDANGKIQLVVPNNSRMARAATGAASEIIWLVTDTIIQAGTSVLPPPFSWLIRGGWWLVKRAAGAPVRAGQTTFDVYASISDARADMPCISTTTNMNPIQVGGLHFQQVTPGNTGISTETYETRAIQQDTNTTTIAVTKALQYVYPPSGDAMMPAQAQWFNATAATTQISSNGFGFLVGSNRWGTHNLLEVEVNIDGGYQQFPNRIPVYFFYNNQQTLAGYAVGNQRDLHQENPSLRVSSVLFQATSSHAYNFSATWQRAVVHYPKSTAITTQASAVVETGSGNTNLRNRVVAGRWYVLQFVNIGVVNKALVAGSAELAYTATGAWPTGNTDFTPTVDDASTGLIPTYASGLHFNTFESTTLAESTSYAAPRLELDESEYYDMPPLEEDEDADDEGEEDTTDADLELGPMDDYDDPPMSRLVVHPDVQKTFEILLELHPEREARLAANRLKPSDEYSEFTRLYHDALVDGLSPRAARAHALGL